jgi:hypothetical protein
MADDEPDNLILRGQRRMDTKLDLILATMNNLGLRTSALEIQIGAVNSRLDDIGQRLERIERRLDLVEPS